MSPRPNEQHVNRGIHAELERRVTELSCFPVFLESGKTYKERGASSQDTVRHFVLLMAHVIESIAFLSHN